MRKNSCAFRLTLPTCERLRIDDGGARVAALHKTYCGTPAAIVAREGGRKGAGERADGHAGGHRPRQGGGRGRHDDSEVSLLLLLRRRRRRPAGSQASKQRVSQYNSERAIRLLACSDGDGDRHYSNRQQPGTVRVRTVRLRRRKQCNIPRPTIGQPHQSAVVRRMRMPARLLHPRRPSSPPPPA